MFSYLCVALVFVAACTAKVQVSTDKADPRNAMCNIKRNAYHKMDGGCHSYIECTEFIPVERSCPDGLHFNPEAQWPSSPCGHPMDVPCARRGSAQPAQPKADCPHQHDNCASPVATPDCGHNRMCENDKAIEMSCPTGQAFNPDTGRCDWHKQVATYNADQFPGFSCPAAPTDASDIIVSYKYQGNCYHFSCVKGHARLLSSDEAHARLLSCDEGHARLPSCDEGFDFDSASGRCVYVGYGNCDGCIQWG